MYINTHTYYISFTIYFTYQCHLLIESCRKPCWPFGPYRRATLPAAGWRSACYLPRMTLSSDQLDPAVAV